MFQFGTNPVAFISHDDKARFRQRTGIHVFTIEECSVDWCLFLYLLYEICQREIVQPHSCQCPHGGLYRFRIEYVDRVLGTIDVLYAKPVGQTDDGA